MVLYEYQLEKRSWTLSIEEKQVEEKERTYKAVNGNELFRYRKTMLKSEIETLLSDWSKYYFYSFSKDKRNEFIEVILENQNEKLQEIEKKLEKEKEIFCAVATLLKSEETK